jgi:hypothetical protein
MKRRKRFTIKMVALGLAVAAVAAPAAQAGPDGMSGPELRSIHDSAVLSAGNVIGGPDDRVIHTYRGEVVTSPDDRAIHGTESPVTQPVSADDGNRFELSTGALSGIVLLLAASAMTAVLVRQNRRGKLASA